MTTFRAGERLGTTDRARDTDPGLGGPRPHDLVIAPMRRRHLRSIVAIQAEDPHPGWSIGLWLSELRHEHDRVYAVALVGRQVVGYAGLLLSDEDGHVSTLGVGQRWQHRGIATRLMLLLARQARLRGAANLTLEVRAGNAAAIALYQRFALAPAGIRKNYYADLGEDALIMWAHAIDTDDYYQRLARLEAELAGATATGAGAHPQSSITIEGFDS